MKVNYSALLLNTDEKVDVSVDEVTICPRCKVAIRPVHLNSIILYDDELLEEHFNGPEDYEDFEIDSIMESQLFCSSCSHSFIAEYTAIFRCIDNEFDYYAYSSKNLFPNYFISERFDDKISKLSPRFVSIYNQALSAETSQLDEISGLGYRKALEFLVKDYAIFKNPKDKDSIKSLPISQCIKKYIDDDRIKTLTERSTWIGNDEAHYVRKHEDRSCSDLKIFIQAIVYFIGMVLITDDAASMLAK